MTSWRASMVGCGIVGRWGEWREGGLGVVVGGGCSAIAVFQPLPLERLQKCKKLSVQQLKKQGHSQLGPRATFFLPSATSFSCLNSYF